MPLWRPDSGSPLVKILSHRLRTDRLHDGVPATTTMQVSQLAHVVALRLNSGPNLLTDFSNSLPALAPSSKRDNGRNWKSLLDNE
jgi:hypothetical protein